MSYCIYTSEAFVFKKRDVGESDKIYSFFTKDFGRVDAAARGVRYLKSKLRYSLLEGSFLRISFVATSGEYWRLVDAEEIMTLDNIRKNYEKASRSFAIFSLIERLIQGQEPDEELWEKLKRLFVFLDKSKLSIDDLKNFEILSALYILNHLGYAAGLPDGEPLSLRRVGAKKDYFSSLVEESLERTQL